MHCNKVAIDIDCVGEYWRPYKKSEPCDFYNTVHMVIRNSKVEEIGVDGEDHSTAELRVSLLMTCDYTKSTTV